MTSLAPRQRQTRRYAAGLYYVETPEGTYEIEWRPSHDDGIEGWYVAEPNTGAIIGVFHTLREAKESIA